MVELLSAFPLAEVMDKAPPIEHYWMTGLIFGAVLFLLCLYKRWFLLLSIFVVFCGTSTALMNQKIHSEVRFAEKTRPTPMA